MGARISIQFKKGEETSPVLFSHWDGNSLLDETKEYLKKLKKEIGDKRTYPLERLQPNTVIIDFIRELTKTSERIRSNYYLGTSEYDGDNSDYGHHIISLD